MHSLVLKWCHRNFKARSLQQKMQVLKPQQYVLWCNVFCMYCIRVGGKGVSIAKANIANLGCVLVSGIKVGDSSNDSSGRANGSGNSKNGQEVALARTTFSNDCRYWPHLQTTGATRLQLRNNSDTTNTAK